MHTGTKLTCRQVSFPKHSAEELKPWEQYLACWAARGPQLGIGLPFSWDPPPVHQHNVAPFLAHQRRD